MDELTNLQATNSLEVDEGSREDWLLKQSGWSKDKLEEEIAKQQEKFAGLLSRENAVEVLARSLQLPPVEKTKVKFTTLSEAAMNGPAKQVNFLVRVWQVYAPKRFQKKTAAGNVREGRVCNIIVRDSTGSASLVLWDKDVEMVDQGKVVRNTILKIVSGTVKTASPLEISSGFITQIKPVSQADYLSEAGTGDLPVNEKPNTALSQLIDGMLDVDVLGRLLNVGKLSEFTRVGKTGAPEKGMVCDGLLSDGSKAIRLVCWDENARLFSTTQAGEAVKVESGYVKTDSRTGRLELHASWRGTVARNAGEEGLSSKQQMWESAYQKSPLSAITEGTVCITTAKVADLPSCRVILKCSQCGTRVIEGTNACPECNSPNLKGLLILRAVLEDGTAIMPAAFFDRQALQLLGLTELTIDAQTALDLKKAYVIGSEVTVVVAGRKNPNDSTIEATVKHVVSAPSIAEPKTGGVQFSSLKEPGAK